MSLTRFRFVLVVVFGICVTSGCRNGKSYFSYASPQPSATSYVAAQPQANAESSPPLPVLTPPAAAADYSSPANSTYSPSTYSPTPRNSSSGCTSGCCSG